MSMLASPITTGDTGRAMSEENVEVARQILGAWNSGDIEGAVEVLDPDCVIDVTARVFNPENR